MSKRGCLNLPNSSGQFFGLPIQPLGTEMISSISGCKFSNCCDGASVAHAMNALGIFLRNAHNIGNVRIQSPIWLSLVINILGDLVFDTSNSISKRCDPSEDVSVVK